MGNVLTFIDNITGISPAVIFGNKIQIFFSVKHGGWFPDFRILFPWFANKG